MRLPKLSEIKSLFTNRAQKPAIERTYRELASVGGEFSDWGLSALGEDAEIYANRWALLWRVRDLARCNPLYQAYRETLFSNVFGAKGTLLRMRVKETEDRVIHTPDEEKAVRAYEERRNRVLEYFATQQGREWKQRVFLHVTGMNGSRKAQVKVGDPDVYANQLIEREWLRWQRAEFCDARKTRNYDTIRQMRLWAAARDGDFFIRMVKSPKVNEYGFALQLINTEWCDMWYNNILPNGNVVRMGIEYKFTQWGIGEPVAYYVIKRQPMDWQFSIPGAFNFASGDLHDRIPADEIIHYCRQIDCDSTRPAPWVASTIPSSRQRDQAMLAEVIAWRQAACKTGFYYSDMRPEGGEFDAPDPRTELNTEEMAPGETRALPWGVKFQPNNPLHPNANVTEFRMASIQDTCAGMPGASYPTMANDYASINFSAGRLSRLDSNETFMLLQAYDIGYAENRIFEEWLYMALTTGAVPLPLAKFNKFNTKIFQGRRWQGVDPVKENQADAMSVENKFSSRTRICSGRGDDFEEVLFELAEEKMLIEQFGMDPMTTAGTPSQDQEEEETETGDEKPADNPPKKKKPAAKKLGKRPVMS